MNSSPKLLYPARELFRFERSIQNFMDKQWKIHSLKTISNIRTEGVTLI